MYGAMTLQCGMRKRNGRSSPGTTRSGRVDLRKQRSRHGSFLSSKKVDENMRTKVLIFGLSTILLAAGVSSFGQERKGNFKVRVKYEEPVRNEKYPELLYWFVTPETIVAPRYSQDI